MYEMYYLIKYGEHNYGDIQTMPVYERKMFYQILLDEAEKKTGDTK